MGFADEAGRPIRLTLAGLEARLNALKMAYGDLPQYTREEKPQPFMLTWGRLKREGGNLDKMAELLRPLEEEVVRKRQAA